MDDIVAAALKKWPCVPHCHGWLGLDARGDWYLRDDRVQAAGPFPQSRGSRLEHAGLRAFIERNYDCDATGAWFFQNGPQRVYVELEAAPWVWRLHPSASGEVSLCAHTGAAATFGSAWLDERGRVYLDTNLGFGLVHTLDMEAAADAIEQGRWTLGEFRFTDGPARFGFRLSPAADAAAASESRP